MEAKFTKGDWSVSPLEVDVNYIRVRGTALGGRFKIANVIDENHHIESNAHIYALEKQEAVANAHLIATAPDMYELLSKMHLESRFVYGEDYDEVEELLSKARGK